MSSPKIQCPGREEQVAALVEDQLPPKERAELVDHLADCTVCYELFTELLRFTEEESGTERGVPAPVLVHPSSRRWSRQVIAAATAAVAVAAVLLVMLLPSLRSQDPLSSAALTEHFADQELVSRLAEDWSDRQWSTFRGPQAPPNGVGQSFRVGARMVDLQLALRTGQTQHALPLAAELYGLTQGDELASPGAAYRELRERLMANEPTQDLLEASRDVEAEVSEDFDRGTAAAGYRLGKLVAAGRLAASVEDGGFFRDPGHRQLFRETLSALGPQAPSALAKVVDLVAKEGLETADFQALEDLFKEILEQRGLPAEGSASRREPALPSALAPALQSPA